MNDYISKIETLIRSCLSISGYQLNTDRITDAFGNPGRAKNESPGFGLQFGLHTHLSALFLTLASTEKFRNHLTGAGRSPLPFPYIFGSSLTHPLSGWRMPDLI